MTRNFVHAFLAIAILGLSACASGPKGQSARPARIQTIDNRQEMGDVIALLDDGRVKEARKKLETMARRDPADQRPQQLLDSLTADPTGTLGTKSFDYRVAPGDSLQGLAQRFLGDRLKFYLLARYNGIAVPSSLKTGQMLRIPGDAPRPVPAEPRPRPAPGPSSPSAPSPTPPKPAKPSSPATDPRAAAQLRARGLAALNKGHVAQAVASLQQALSLDPANALIRSDLNRARRIQQTVRRRN